MSLTLCHGYRQYRNSSVQTRFFMSSYFVSRSAQYLSYFMMKLITTSPSLPSFISRPLMRRMLASAASHLNSALAS